MGWPIKEKILITLYEDIDLKSELFEISGFKLRCELKELLSHNDKYICNKSPKGSMRLRNFRLTLDGREYVERVCNIESNDNNDDKTNKWVDAVKNNWPSLLINAAQLGLQIKGINI